MILQAVDYQFVTMLLYECCFWTEKSNNFGIVYHGRELVNREKQAHVRLFAKIKAGR